jgi:IMP dehydrogenase
MEAHPPVSSHPIHPLAHKFILEAITFDDVLLVPRRSGVVPTDADLTTRLTRSISLGIPLVSAPMDTVTESRLAIALAQEGGIGIIHRNMSPEVQAREVTKVKRSEHGVITDPMTLGPNETLGQARQAMIENNISGMPVVEGGACGQRIKGKVLGILTGRDLTFHAGADDRPVREVMTSKNLVTAPPDTELANAVKILSGAKVKKLLLVDDKGVLAGLITLRDVEQQRRYPKAAKDERGRLRCGAAIGVHQYERAQMLIDADVDLIIVDTSHGHSENVMNTVKELKKRHTIDVIAGNVATADAARALMEAGVDAVKVGIGPGSICTTRVVTGVGVPQVTAIMEAVSACERNGVPVIADGGIRQSGDIAKALAAGAHTVMMGGLFAGLDESPGELVISEGRRYKTYRGMGSEGAMFAGSADRYGQGEKLKGSSGDLSRIKFVPEGVEGLVPYRGGLADFVYQMCGGVRASMGYLGCKTIEEFRKESRFCRVSRASVIESHPHDIKITKESPNYSPEGRH